MTMRPNVETKLESIFSYPFFQSVGKPLGGAVTPVSTWTAAVKMCHSQKWESCQLMARNELFDRVQKKSWDRAQEWNPIAEELRPLILSFVDRLLAKFPLQDKALKNVRGAVSWDIMLICFELEYSDIIEPFFYITLIDPWYAAGHFPCGWDGDEFTDEWDGVVTGGQMIVY